jgi:hypothetical protein
VKCVQSNHQTVTNLISKLQILSRNAADWRPLFLYGHDCENLRPVGTRLHSFALDCQQYERSYRLHKSENFEEKKVAGQPVIDSTHNLFSLDNLQS